MIVPADFTGGSIQTCKRGGNQRAAGTGPQTVSCANLSSLNFIWKTMGKETKTFRLGSNMMRFMFEKDDSSS